MPASTTPAITSKPMISIGDLGADGGMCVMAGAQKYAHIVTSTSDAMTAAIAIRNAVSRSRTTD